MSWRRSLEYAFCILLGFCVYHTLYTMEREILSQHPCHFDINLALYNLEIYWIELQPGLTRNHHPDHPSNQKFRTIRTQACSLVEGITSIAVTKIVVSVQLEPKWQFGSAAILDCLLHDGRIEGNHFGIMP